MAGEEKKVTELEQETEEIIAEPEPKSIRGSALSKISRELSDEDLKSTAVVRLILDRKDQLEAEVQDLRECKEDYYEVNKEAAVLTERLKSLQESINSKSVFICLGSILAGALPSLFNNKSLFAAAMFISFIFLLIGFFKKK